MRRNSAVDGGSATKTAEEKKESIEGNTQRLRAGSQIFQAGSFPTNFLWRTFRQQKALTASVSWCSDVAIPCDALP